MIKKDHNTVNKIFNSYPDQFTKVQSYLNDKVIQSYDLFKFSFSSKIQKVIVPLIIHNYRHTLKDKFSLLNHLDDLDFIVQGIISVFENNNYFKYDRINDIYLYVKYPWQSKKSKNLINIFFDTFSSFKDLEYNQIVLFSLIAFKVVQLAIRDESVFKSDLIESDKVIYDLRKLPALEKWYRKCLILDYIKKSNLNNKEIGKLLHVNEETVASIRKKYEKNHFLTYDDLKEKQHGSKANPFIKITEKVYNKLVKALSKPTSDYDLEEPNWSVQTIHKFLKKYNIEISISYLYAFLSRMKINSKVGKRYNPKQDKEEVKNFKAKKYGEIVKEAAENNEIVCFGDQVYVQQGHGIRSYSKKGARSIICYHQSTRHTKCCLFTIIGPQGFYRIFLNEGTFDTGQLIFCLKTIHQENPDKKFLLILDNASMHTSKELNNWLNRKNGGKAFIRIKYLPAYAPETNPVEYFNNYFKSYLKKFLMLSAKEVVDKAREFIADIRYGNQNESKQKMINFCKAEDCKYSFDEYVKFYKVENL